jgi:hypothetical protein
VPTRCVKRAIFSRFWWENNKDFTPIFSGLGTGSSLLSIRNNSRYLAARFRLTQNLSTTSAFTPIANPSVFMGTLGGTDSFTRARGFFDSIIHDRGMNTGRRLQPASSVTRFEDP